MDLPPSMRPVDRSNNHGFAQNLHDLLPPPLSATEADNHQREESYPQRPDGVDQWLQPDYPDGVNFRDFQSDDVDSRPKKSYGRGLARIVTTEAPAAVGGQCGYQIRGREEIGRSLTDEMPAKLQLSSFPAPTNVVGKMQQDFRSGYNLLGTQQDLNLLSVATAGQLLGPIVTTKSYPERPFKIPALESMNVVKDTPHGYLSQKVASRSPITQMQCSVEPLVSQPKNIGMTQHWAATHSGVGIPTQHSVIMDSGSWEENRERVSCNMSQSAHLIGELNVEDYSEFVNQKEKSFESQLDPASRAEAVNSHNVISLDTQGGEPSSALMTSLKKPVQKNSSAYHDVGFQHVQTEKELRLSQDSDISKDESSAVNATSPNAKAEERFKEGANAVCSNVLDDIQGSTVLSDTNALKEGTRIENEGFHIRNKEGGGVKSDPEGPSDDPFAKDCAACSRNPADSFFYPCMEFAFCRLCAHKFFEKYGRCPYCRENIERIVLL